jgi:glycosyltransferase involved in cell wall biosynthesis
MDLGPHWGGDGMQYGKSVKRHLLCTIITPNYVDQFLALGRSVATAMPLAELRVLILQDCSDVSLVQERIDDYLRAAESSASHKAITIDECDWGDFDIEAASLFYSILEFATSVKPALLRSFLGEGWERVTYLDPDIQVFEDFTALLDDDCDVSLTPHFLTDIPRDHFRPTTNDVLNAGFFNLGFCSARPSATKFLDWWCGQLQFDCLIDPSAGYFTDQKILDLAPMKTKVQSLDDPGCNVAYWNLHERHITREGESWRVTYDGSSRSLYFFHFSGFEIAQTPSISKHANRKVLGSAVPRTFTNQYAAQLLDAKSSYQPIAFTLNGTSLKNPVPSQWNRCLREDAEVHFHAGMSLRQVREDVYAPQNQVERSACHSCDDEHDNFGTRVQSFLSGWACHPSIEGVPNAIAAFYRTAHFEHSARPMEQLSWASEHMTDSAKDFDDLVVDILHAAAQAVRNTVNLKVIGYFTYPAGYGQIARWTLQTLEDAGIHPAIERIFEASDSNEYLSRLLKRDNPLAASNASVLCIVNADQWHAQVMSKRRVNPAIEHVEVVWAWELEDIPSEMYDIASSGNIERVHALSRWSVEAMSKVLPIPVQRFAPFDLGLFNLFDTAPREKATAPSPARYVMTTIDAKSYVSRKNPEGVLNLWKRVEADFPNHSLIIKSTDMRNLSTPELLDLIDNSTRTMLIDEYLTGEEYFELLTKSDAYISLHRSEGLGLTPIEAGLSGTPVVYTNYSGVSEFLGDGFFPVSYAMIPVGTSDHETGPYNKLALWADPDLEDAERQLRRALETSRDDESASSLTKDRERLRENLVVAQHEVVATANRLMKLMAPWDRLRHDHLVERLMTPPPRETKIETPDPNSFLYTLVLVAYRTYKILPRALRRQINLAFSKLTKRHDDLINELNDH